MNILIKLMSIVSLIIAPHIGEGGHSSADHLGGFDNASGEGMMITNQGYYFEGEANRVKLNVGGEVSLMQVQNMEFQGVDDNTISDLAITFIPDLVAEALGEYVPEASHGLASAYFIGRGFQRMGDKNVFEGSGTLNTEHGKIPAYVTIILLDKKRFNAVVVLDI